MIKNTSIKKVLIISFSTLTVLLVLLGLVSLSQVRQSTAMTIEFYEKPHAVQISVINVQKIMGKIGLNLQSAIIEQSAEKTQSALTRIQTLLTDMNSEITVVKDSFSGDKNAIAKADTVTETWLSVVNELQDLLRQNNYVQAEKRFTESYVASQDAWDNEVNGVYNESDAISKSYYDKAKSIRVTAPAIIFVFVCVSIIISVSMSFIVTKSIAAPMRIVRDAADRMAKGDLHQEIPYNGNNEFGHLAESIRSSSSAIAKYVDNIDYILGKLAAKDLTVQVEMDYIGDFKPIKKSIDNIIRTFQLTFKEISDAGEEVYSGSKMVADSSSAISQGSSEQAGSVEELLASITEISSQVSNNAEYVSSTNRLVEDVGQRLVYGNKQMAEMLVAISEINQTSSQIAKIIKTIEDIAFQTNILALNAAVEAARAGSAGKGFAVVADEVRNLAAKSATAAKSTTDLIKNSISAVSNGTSIANSTAETLSSIVNGAQEITTMVAKIASASEEQVGFINRITESTNQISTVIQMNSATSEETAAASQTLSGQALLLDEQIRKFKLPTVII